MDCVISTGCIHADRPYAWLCQKGCEQQHARALIAKWKAEDEERAERGKYLGCPVCKQRVLFNCYHDGVDYTSVELDLPVPA